MNFEQADLEITKELNTRPPDSAISLYAKSVLYQARRFAEQSAEDETMYYLACRAYNEAALSIRITTPFPGID